MLCQGKLEISRHSRYRFKIRIFAKSVKKHYSNKLHSKIQIKEEIIKVYTSDWSKLLLCVFDMGFQNVVSLNSFKSNFTQF